MTSVHGPTGTGVGATTPITAIDVEATLLEYLKQATVGEFEVIRELGRGGMAMVYLAKDLSLNRDVAIKVMSPTLGADASMTERFVREAQTAASLSHPNIIPVYAVRQTANITFFVMKFIKGRPLDDIMDEVGALPVDLASAILSQVAGALGYGHKRGIVHRDVKPGNVMIDDEGWAVVTDFGIAKVDHAEGLTQTGAAIGTPTYMSPEQCTAKPVTGASDQYSLGVVAYEMLTGKKPFDGDSVMSIMYAHVNEPPPPFLQDRPDCPPELHDAVMQMLAKSAQERFAAMDDVVAALASVASGARGDSARTEMISLAQSGLSSKVIGKVRTPQSPMPLESIQKSAVRSRPVGTGVRPSAPTVQTPSPGDAVDSGSLINSGQVVPPARKKPVGLIAAAAVVIVGVVGVVMAAPWETTATDTGGSPPDTVAVTADPGVAVAASVTIDAPTTTVVEGDDIAMTAQVLDANGDVVDAHPEWTSSDNRIALVDAGGVVVGRGAGTAEITARAGDVSSSVTVQVQARPANRPVITVASVRVAPSQETLDVGASTRLTATVIGSDDRPMNRSATWTSSNPAVASVVNGQVTAVSPGEATITASRDGRRANARITVQAPAVAQVQISAGRVRLLENETTSVTAAVRDARGNPVTGRRPTWTSSDPAVLTVDTGGLVRAIRAGTAEVTGVVDGQRGAVSITVEAVARQPVLPTEAQSRTAIARIIESYRRAFESRDIDAVRSAFAGITSQQRTQWGTFFNGVQELSVRHTPDPPDIVINGRSAEARFRTRYDFNAGGARGNNEFDTVATFEFQGSDWVMTGWRAAGNGP